MKYLHRLFFILTSATFFAWVVTTILAIKFEWVTGQMWFVITLAFIGKKLGQNIVRNLVNGKKE